MKRDMIQIDETLCDGCGLCITACHEGALALVEGKAKLVKESWCDGLGACLPACPTGALRIVQLESEAFDASAVKANQAAAASCPGTRLPSMSRQATSAGDGPGTQARGRRRFLQRKETTGAEHSELRHWPVQLKLVPAGAPFFNQAHLLIAADCTAYARAGFHRDFLRGRVALIGCPKLDTGDYTDKLSQIFHQNAIKSIMVVRMSVPCCGGLEFAVRNALRASGKVVPWQVVTLSPEGDIVDT